MIDELKKRLQAEERAVHIQEGQEKMLRDTKERLTARLEERRLEGEDLLKVRALFQKLSFEARLAAKKKIEEMGTHSLQAVFGGGYRFEVDMKELKGRPHADFLVVSPYGEVSLEGEKQAELRTPPEDSRGGGVVDVLSQALRFAMMDLNKEAGLMILDEPAKHVSKQFAPRVVDFIKTLAERRKLQFIIVTHNDLLTDAADRSFYVDMENGTSHVKEGQSLEGALAAIQEALA